MPDFSSLIDGVGYNTPTGGPSGLFLSLDPAYQAKQLANQQAQLQLNQEQAFKGGLPADQSGGTDWNAAAQRMYQLGAFDQGNNLLSTGVRMTALNQLMGRGQQDAGSPGGVDARDRKLMTEHTKRVSKALRALREEGRVTSAKDARGT